MKFFRDLSIKTKFLTIVLFTSAVSLLFTSAAVVVYDANSFRETLVDELAAHADIVAHNSAAALTFDDGESAAETLLALRATGGVITAYILDTDDEIFARYVRDERTPVAARPLLAEPGYRFFDDRLAMLRPIVLDDEAAGAVYIEGDLSALRARLKRYVGMATAVVACAMVIVLLLSSRFQRAFSGPILRLAETAKTISRRKNYAVRAEKTSEDEVGTLIDGFNEMLDQIQARDGKLERHRDELEREVALRTGELRDVNVRLKESEARIRAIVEGTSATTGVEFFDALSITLARALGMRWVMVGLLVPGNRMEAKALWDGTRIVRDIVYDLSGTPCERAVTDSFAVYEDGVVAQFPDDEILREWKVSSYVGVVLRDSAGTPIGVLNAFHEEPIPELARHGSLLRVFASRAAAELERMLVEEELQRSESRTRAILDSAADGIVTISDGGAVETFNHAAEQIFALDAAAAYGRGIAELMRFPVDEEGNEALRTRPEPVLSSFVGKRVEIEGVRADGVVFPMNVVTSRMEVAGRTSFTAIVRDVTRERELEQMKSDFVSTVSHEIRTPLSCIISSAKILKKNGDAKPDVTAKFSGIIADEGKRLSRLINDLLDLSKIDSGGLEWTFKDADAEDLIDHVVVRHRQDARAHEIDLSVAVDGGVPSVKVDRDKFVQVLSNLISNAIKFTDRGGHIVVAAARHDAERVRISVMDNGVGIAPEHQQVIFDRFRQLGNVLTDRPQGSGLGLHISKEIVESLGGEIWVDSEPGKGSTFAFTVCAAEAADDSKTEEGAVESRPSVLVVDDEETTRELVTYLLDVNGFDATAAGCGSEALASVRERRPDLIALDVMMPGMTGYEVLEALRGDDDLADIPVLLMSVFGDPAHTERGLRLGASAYLNKPIDESTLVGTLQRLLRGEGRRVLIVDDDEHSRAEIKADLARQGYTAVEAPDVRRGAELARSVQPDLVIVGPQSGTVDGSALVKSLRDDERTSSIPILVVTGFELHGVNAAYLDATTAAETSARGSVSDLLTSLLDNRSALDRAADDDRPTPGPLPG